MLFCYYAYILVKLGFINLAILKNEEMIKTRERLLLSENVIFPPNKSCTLFVIYLHKTLSSFILQCLYHYKVVAKPAKMVHSVTTPVLPLTLSFAV